MCGATSEEQIQGVGKEPAPTRRKPECSPPTASRQRSITAGSASAVTSAGTTGPPEPGGTSSTCSAGKPEGRHTMFWTPESIKAETAYRQERIKRAYGAK